MYKVPFESIQIRCPKPIKDEVMAMIFDYREKVRRETEKKKIKQRIEARKALAASKVKEWQGKADDAEKLGENDVS